MSGGLLDKAPKLVCDALIDISHEPQTFFDYSCSPKITKQLPLLASKLF